MQCQLPEELTPSISLVLPAWNEQDVILSAIAEADSALNCLTQAFEIIVVDDGSNDGTSGLVAVAAEANQRIRLIRHPKNLGYGAALRSGFLAARMDLVAFTDADCQFDLSELSQFVELIKEFDVVCGYRLDRKDSFLRLFYSKVYNRLSNKLLRTGVRDVDCALKMFRIDVVKQLEITKDGFLVNSELLVQARKQNRSLVEVGVTHRPRTRGQSTVSITHIPAVLLDLWDYWRALARTSHATTKAMKLGVRR
jgi:dolichol-phosphate mannosyltransferase